MTDAIKINTNNAVRRFAAVIHYVSMALQFMLDQPERYTTIKAKPLALRAVELSGGAIDYQEAIDFASQVTGSIRRLEMLK